MSKKFHYEVLIIGAGISGLLAASELHKTIGNVGLIDKSRGVGGRMATRRLSESGIGELRVDHGAQYFTIRSPQVKILNSDWLKAELVYEWKGIKTDESVFACANGMTTLPKAIANDLAAKERLHLNERAIRIDCLNGQAYRYAIHTETGTEYWCNRMVLTAPVPQSLALLKESDLPVTQQELDDLSGITYSPCIALLGSVDGITHLPDSGGLKVTNHPVIQWIANNHAKGISPVGPGITIHANANWSKQHWDLPAGLQEEMLIEAASEWISPMAWQSTEVKKWRYALVESPMLTQYYSLSQCPGILLAGDGFSGGRVEEAMLSGLAVANFLHLGHAAVG